MSDQETCLLTDEEDIWIFCLEKSLKKSKIYVFLSLTTKYILLRSVMIVKNFFHFILIFFAKAKNTADDRS